MINFKQHFATTYRRLTKNTTAFVYQSTCLVHFTMLAPINGVERALHHPPIVGKITQPHMLLST